MIGLIRLAGALLLLLTAGILPAAPHASANGAPVRIILGYLDGVSNWGPTNATGAAEVVAAEGEVGGSVVGLPPLTGEVYAGWLMNTASGETFRIGSFNAKQEGVTRFSYRLASEIPDRNWNLFLLTVETEGGSEAAPAERRSLAGFFPTAQQTGERPSALPRTGGDSDPVALPAARPASVPPAAASPGTVAAAVGGMAVAVALIGGALLARRRRQ